MNFFNPTNEVPSNFFQSPVPPEPLTQTQSILTGPQPAVSASQPHFSVGNPTEDSNKLFGAPPSGSHQALFNAVKSVGPSPSFFNPNTSFQYQGDPQKSITPVPVIQNLGDCIVPPIAPPPVTAPLAQQNFIAAPPRVVEPTLFNPTDFSSEAKPTVIAPPSLFNPSAVVAQNSEESTYQATSFFNPVFPENFQSTGTETKKDSFFPLAGPPKAIFSPLDVSHPLLTSQHQEKPVIASERPSSASQTTLNPESSFLIVGNQGVVNLPPTGEPPAVFNLANQPSLFKPTESAVSGSSNLFNPAFVAQNPEVPKPVLPSFSNPSAPVAPPLFYNPVAETAGLSSAFGALAVTGAAPTVFNPVTQVSNSQEIQSSESITTIQSQQAPSSVSVLPPTGVSGNTSFRLQKGTRLYKSPFRPQDQTIFNSANQPTHPHQTEFAPPPAFGLPNSQGFVSNPTYLPPTSQYPVFSSKSPSPFVAPPPTAVQSNFQENKPVASYFPSIPREEVPLNKLQAEDNFGPLLQAKPPSPFVPQTVEQSKVQHIIEDKIELSQDTFWTKPPSPFAPQTVDITKILDNYLPSSSLQHTFGQPPVVSNIEQDSQNNQQASLNQPSSSFVPPPPINFQEDLKEAGLDSFDQSSLQTQQFFQPAATFKEEEHKVTEETIGITPLAENNLHTSGLFTSRSEVGSSELFAPQESKAIVSDQSLFTAGEKLPAELNSLFAPPQNITSIASEESEKTIPENLSSITAPESKEVNISNFFNTTQEPHKQIPCLPEFFIPTSEPYKQIAPLPEFFTPSTLPTAAPGNLTSGIQESHIAPPPIGFDLIAPPPPQTSNPTSDSGVNPFRRNSQSKYPSVTSFFAPTNSQFDFFSLANSTPVAPETANISSTRSNPTASADHRPSLQLSSSEESQPKINISDSSPEQATSSITGAGPEDLNSQSQPFQSFFNNPPPQDVTDSITGDLNYNLVGSSLQVSVQTRSLTPASNLVEPPSSSCCSEFSELNSSTASALVLDNTSNKTSPNVSFSLSIFSN